MCVCVDLNVVHCACTSGRLISLDVIFRARVVVYIQLCVLPCVAFQMHVLSECVCEHYGYMDRRKHLTFTLEAPYVVSTKKREGRDFVQ